MKAYNESELRRKADIPTIKMLDLWHEVGDRAGVKIDVHLGDRHDNHEFSAGAAGAEVNTALPMTFNGRPILMIWLESPFTHDFSWELVTHELGHWILFANGYTVLDTQAPESFWTKALIASMAHHTPLLKLQEMSGHDGNKEFDRAASKKFELYTRYDMSRQSEVSQRNRSLEIADSLLHASPHVRTEVETRLRTDFSQLEEEVHKILNVVSAFELNDQQANIDCQRQLYELYGLPIELTEMNQYRDWVRQISI